jgi:hypothetical protein
MNIRPLLNRRSLRPSESLPSLFARLGRVNYYGSSSAIAAICRSHMRQKDDVFLPMHADTWQILSGVTGLQRSVLYRATFHRYAAALALPWEQMAKVMLADGDEHPLLPPRVQKQFLLSAYDAQFCPHCLLEGHYHRVGWLNALAAICVRHECLLQRGCPQCDRKLSVQAIVGGSCERCQHDLATTPVVSISEDNWGVFTQQLMQSWWGDAAQPRLPEQATLLGQPPAILLELLRGLALAAARLPASAVHHGVTMAHVSRRDARKRPPPIQVYGDYAAVMKIVVDWPDGFHQFLDAHRGRSAESGQVTAELGSMYHLWLERHWRHPKFSFVQAAFDDYLVANYPLSRSVTRLGRYQRSRALRDRFPYLTQVEAAERLGVILEIIPRLVEVGLLADDERDLNQPRPRHIHVVRRREFVELQQRWQTGIPVSDVAHLLGVEAQVIDDLVGAGRLTQHFREHNGGVVIEKEALNAFVSRLHRFPSIPHDMGETVPLRKLADSSHSLIFFLELVVDGKLSAVWFGGDLYGLQVSQRGLQSLKQPSNRSDVV